jgi:hypothetical protein
MNNPFANNSTANQRGQNNLNQGVFIDDIIIGFASRGEMVTGATNNSAHGVNTNLRTNELLTGEYQLEIRRGTDYTIRSNVSGTTSQSIRTFDVNDRFIQGH